MLGWDEQWAHCLAVSRWLKSWMGPECRTAEKCDYVWSRYQSLISCYVNPLNPELNPICYLLALLGAHHFLHFSRIRVKLLTLRRLMSYIYIYIYMEHPFLMFLDHTQRRSTIGRTPLDEWSARRRDLYLTTHDTHNRQISMPSVGFEPTISAGERQGRLPAEVVGSNPTGGMDIFLLWVSCVVR